jgi:hypothetical protein
MTHLTEDEIEFLSRTRDQDTHTRTCAECRTKLQAWRNLTMAARQAEPAVTVPAFDALLPRLPAQRPADDAVPVVAVGPGGAWRVLAGIAKYQLRLLPRALGPVTLLGLGGAVALALTVPYGAMADRLFAALTSLVVLIGALTACRRRGDPRTELLGTMTVTPMEVFACRLAIVMGADLALAMLASVVVAITAGHDSLLPVVTGWLAPALLASSAGVFCSVWRSQSTGLTVGVVLWLFGSLRPPDVLAHEWTQPTALTLSALLLAVAMYGMHVRLGEPGAD